MPAGDHRRSERPTMWSRAERHTGEGAGALFARLEATERASRGRTPQARAAAALERAAARLRAGEWSAGLAELAARAEALEVEEPVRPGGTRQPA